MYQGKTNEQHAIDMAIWMNNALRVGGTKLFFHPDEVFDKVQIARVMTEQVMGAELDSEGEALYDIFFAVRMYDLVEPVSFKDAPITTGWKGALDFQTNVGFHWRETLDKFNQYFTVDYDAGLNKQARSQLEKDFEGDFIGELPILKERIPATWAATTFNSQRDIDNANLEYFRDRQIDLLKAAAEYDVYLSMSQQQNGMAPAFQFVQGHGLAHPVNPEKNGIYDYGTYTLLSANPEQIDSRVSVPKVFVSATVVSKTYVEGPPEGGVFKRERMAFDCLSLPGTASQPKSYGVLSELTNADNHPSKPIRAQPDRSMGEAELSPIRGSAMVAAKTWFDPVLSGGKATSSDEQEAAKKHVLDRFADQITDDPSKAIFSGQLLSAESHDENAMTNATNLHEAMKKHMLERYVFVVMERDFFKEEIQKHLTEGWEVAGEFEEVISRDGRTTYDRNVVLRKDTYGGRGKITAIQDDEGTPVSDAVQKELIEIDIEYSELVEKTNSLEPWDPSLTEEQKALISKRCMVDLVYFAEKVVKTASLHPENVIKFTSDLGGRGKAVSILPPHHEYMSKEIPSANKYGPAQITINTQPDEPFFVLLGRDPQAPDLVDQWAMDRNQLEMGNPKVTQAIDIASLMRDFKHHNPELGMDINLYQNHLTSELFYLAPHAEKYTEQEILRMAMTVAHVAQLSEIDLSIHNNICFTHLSKQDWLDQQLAQLSKVSETVGQGLFLAKIVDGKFTDVWMPEGAAEKLVNTGMISTQTLLGLNYNTAGEVDGLPADAIELPFGWSDGDDEVTDDAVDKD